MLMVMTVIRRTDHVARHVTAESSALAPVEPVRVFLPDDLDQLEGGTMVIMRIMNVQMKMKIWMWTINTVLKTMMMANDNGDDNNLSLSERQLLLTGLGIW